jgi:hypothetical protein
MEPRITNGDSHHSEEITKERLRTKGLISTCSGGKVMLSGGMIKKMGVGSSLVT